jgi:vacuolar-type H+-ATPase subunit I/STV1
LSDDKKLPKQTEEEKEIRKYKINFFRTRITAKKYCNKYFSSKGEIIVPDDTRLNELYKIEEQYDEKEDALYKNLFEAKESKNKDLVNQLNKEIKELRKNLKNLNKEINDEQNKRLSYTRSAKPMLDAQKLLKQAENYAHFEQIKERYDEAKKNVSVEA